MCFAVVVTLTCAGWAVQAVAQTTISTDGNVEALGFIGDGSLVTEVDAQLLDGMDSSDFAQEVDLMSTEAMLLALQAQVDALGTAQVPRTGQTTCYDAAGAVVTCGTGIGLAQDGDLQLGVTWPNPRFTDNADGTVTDNLTSLIWLENANCANATMNWAAALAFANTLFDGSTGHNGGDCGLSDLSAVGAWRLPNVRELQSLVHYGVSGPAVPNTSGTGKWVAGDPFSGVVSSFYWSSTTGVAGTAFAWGVDLNSGNVNFGNKASDTYVWPVRGGQ